MLDDLVVLDLSHYLPGSYASLLLADLGATVIKIERPPDGTATRSSEPTLHGEGWRFLQRNRNKQSLCLDLKSDAGTEVFYDLASRSDVVIEGFRPGVVDRLNVGYETITAINSMIVYCSITGFGQKGPLADRTGHDINYQAITGVLDATREGERPVVPGIPLGDYASGLFTAFSILVALIGRQRHGGQHIDVSISDVLFSWMSGHAGEYFGTDGDHDPTDALTSGRYPCYGVYETADGRYLALGALEPKYWERFCVGIDREELIDDHLERDGRERRRETVQRRLRERPREAWVETFEDVALPLTPVNSIEEALASRHIDARKLIRTGVFEGSDLPLIASPLGFSKYDIGPVRAPPRLGEDNRSTLESLGYDESKIEELLVDGVVR